MRFSSFVLENGLRVVLAERRSFPTLAADLLIDTRAANADALGAWRASLMGAVFLSPAAGMLHTSGECGPVGCSAVSSGTSEQLDEVLGRIADLVCVENASREAYVQRLGVAVTSFEQGGFEPSRVIDLNARALVFGLGPLYGVPATMPAPPALEDLEEFRRRAFVPRASTLVVVGDVDRVGLEAAVRKRFAAWPDRPKPEAARITLLKPLERPSLVIVQDSRMAQTYGAMAVLGPAPRDPDYAAFCLLAYLLGGTGDASLLRHARLQLGAGYSMGATLLPLPETSMLVVRGVFERRRALEAMVAMRDAFRAVRSAELADDTIAHAKRAFMAGWRAALSTDAGTAQLANAWLSRGLSLETLQDSSADVLAVTPSRVLAVAQRYLDPLALSTIIVGESPDLKKLDQSGFEPPEFRDRFGLRASNPSSR
jgi:predicted Zn-dependent peptidase